MITEEKQYEYIGAVITDRLDRSRDSFKLFLQLFSAIVGGSFWLSKQGVSSDAATYRYIVESDALVVLVITVTGIMVYRAYRGWWGYREALARFDGGNFPIPRPSRGTLWAEKAMLGCMALAGGIFIAFNPFASN
jgi:hypothetical protein